MQLKYVGTRREVTQMLTHAMWSINYRVGHSTWVHTIRMAEKWHNERDYNYREQLNEVLKKHASENYDLSPSNLIDVTTRRILVVVPYDDRGSMFRTNVSWKGDQYTIAASVDNDDWVKMFAQILFKLAYDFKNIVKLVEIDGRTMKVGEWLAALLYDLTGDRAGMLATIDAVEDRR